MSHDLRARVAGRTIALDPARIRPRPPREDRFPSVSSLALDIAGGCNMKCAYCAESMTLPKRTPMDPEIRARAVEALFEWSPHGSGVSLHFGSGEPLLEPHAVHAAGRQAKKLAREHGRPLSLHLTTNGTRLDAGVIAWLVRDGWDVKVSLDGPRETHDGFRRSRNGRGTYTSIESRVRKLASIIPGRFSTTAVLCRGADPAAVFAATARLGVRKIELVPVAAPRGSPLLLAAHDADAYRRFTRAYASRLAGRREQPVSIRFRKRIQRVLGLGNSQVACGAGRNFFAVDPAGTLYPCFRFLGVKQYALGDIHAGLDAAATARFVGGPGRPYSRRAECRRCWAAPLCDGPCFACVELIGDGSPPPGFCEMTRADCEGALWLAEELRPKNPKKLCLLAGIDLGL